MGDLSWDSFEPSQGRFDFGWFDKIMDEMQANGIRVILDTPRTARADLASSRLSWRRPGESERDRFAAAERYMDDISDPDYARRHRCWPTQ